MKKVVYILLGFFLVMAMVAAVGCTKSTPAPTTQTITGTVTGNPIAGPIGNQTITITTPTGVQVFPINPMAATTYAGNVCAIDQVNQYVADNTTYQCTIVLGNEDEAVAVYVQGP
jgi:uncharacterized protein YcfJ